MAGIGIGIGVGLGGGSGWSEAAIARLLAARGLSDADARAAIGGAGSLIAGLRTVGLLPARTVAPSPAPASPPAATALPSGIAAMWDPASLAALGNGAPVTSWTDSVGGAVAVQTDDSTASNMFVADSGGLPALRLSGEAVMATSGGNAAYAALSGQDNTVVVVARAIRDINPDQQNPGLFATGGNPNTALFATPGQTGRFGRMTGCGDPGMRTIAASNCGSRGLRLLGINGSAISDGGGLGGGQAYIGGWQSRNASLFCGRADILAIIVWNRALSAAELKQVHRHYCELLGQARPGGSGARTVSFVGDSLTEGFQSIFPIDYAQSYGGQLVAGLGLPWGTFDLMGFSGDRWDQIRDRAVPMLGNVSATTGARSLVCAFEFANMANFGGREVAGYARQVIDALHAQDDDREVIFGTSTDDGSLQGVNGRQHRADYNAFWDDADNRSGIAAYVPLHLDPRIGVAGVAPTDGTANTWYQPDGLHFQAAGYALIDNGPHGFRSAVQERLAA